MMEDEIPLRDKAHHFEAVKMTMTQDKDGVMLKLRIHPNEVPDDMFRDWVGSRYMVAAVLLDDASEPVSPNSVREAERAIQSAGMLCRTQKFADWMVFTGLAFGTDEEHVKQILCDYLGIKSRSEMKANREARKKFIDLRIQYEKETGG
jgi:hypothetical protein